MKRCDRKLLAIALLMLLRGVVFAEVDSKRDSIANFKEQILVAKRTLCEHSSRNDLLIYIANRYAWISQYDSAMVYLNRAEEAGYLNDDYYGSRMNVLLWSNKYDELLDLTLQAEQSKYENKEDILLKRLVAYAHTNRFQQAVELMNKDENKAYLSSDRINGIYTEILRKRNSSLINVNYAADVIDGLDTQHTGLLGYETGLGRHRVGIKGNYVNRFNTSDFQLEMETMFSLGGVHQLYLDYGYAFMADLYPKNRFGLEYYLPLKTFASEISAGIRYLDYDLTPNAFIITGHYEKYLSKHWISLRPFYVLIKSSQLLSCSLNYRWYQKDGISYWGSEATYGSSPEDSYLLTQNAEFNQLHVYRAKLEYNCALTRVAELKFGLVYAKEEFIKSRYRNRYSFEMTYVHRIK